jgi:steroid delta-isomerase-like uncharacterized protein
MSEQNKKLVRNLIYSVNSRDWESLRMLLTQHFIRHSNAGGDPEVCSAAELITFLKNECVAFPDAQETVLDLVAEGEKVAVRSHFFGTQSGYLGSYPPSGKVLSATTLAIYPIEEGRIAEAWAEWDNLYGLRQLGHTNAS